MKKEGHLEVPSWQVHLRKPEFLLLSCIAESWLSSFSKEGRVAPVSKALVESALCPNGNFRHFHIIPLNHSHLACIAEMIQPRLVTSAKWR